MSVAVIIATHGAAAEPLLRTTEMLVGEQKGAAFIEFMPGENADTIVEKYQQILQGPFADYKQVLFLVDLWGGSPFNAANRVIENNSNMNMVAGVNIPMLVEVLMGKDTSSLEELVDIAVESGTTGIKALRNQVKAAVTEEKVKAAQPTHATEGEHMKFGLVRIDDRLIHGQVATRWTKETKVSRIIVVNDDIAKDKMRITMLKQAVPPGVSGHVVDTDKMLRVYNNPKYNKENVMLLFTNPTDVLKMINLGLDIKSVNIGGMAFKDGKTMITNAVAVNQTDIDAFMAIDKLGIEQEIRKVSSDSKVSVVDLIKKLNS